MELERARELVNNAREMKHRGKYEEALAFRLEAERLYDRMGATTLERVNNLNFIAYLAACVDDPAEAVCAAEKCLAIYGNVSDRRDDVRATSGERRATYLSMMCFVLAEAGRFEEAIPYGEAALSIFIANHGPDNDFVRDRAADVECMRRREKREYLDREGRIAPTAPPGDTPAPGGT